MEWEVSQNKGMKNLKELMCWGQASVSKNTSEKACRSHKYQVDKWSCLNCKENEEHRKIIDMSKDYLRCLD